MPELVTIDSLMLANHVEAVNGLLYISGGGWTDHHRVVPPGGNPPVSHFGIGLSLRIPWNETNQPHRLTIRIEDEDASTVVASVDSQFNAGRPPTLKTSSDQHATLGFTVDTVFPHAGGYRIVARIGEEGDVKSWTFRVHDVPALPGVMALPR